MTDTFLNMLRKLVQITLRVLQKRRHLEGLNNINDIPVAKLDLDIPLQVSGEFSTHTVHTKTKCIYI